MDPFGHVFLIPSDGSYEASLSLAAEQGHATSMWRPGCAAEGKDLLSLVNSLSLDEETGISGKQASQPSQEGSTSRASVPAANAGECGGESAVAAKLGASRCGESSSTRGKRGVVAALRSRRLPDVQQLLMSRSPGAQQPGEVQMEQIVLQEQQPAVQEIVARQEGQFGSATGKITGASPTGERFQVQASPQPVKTTGRGRQGEKLFTSRGCSLLNDSSLALQTALVTVLHLQRQGPDPQRKPIIPKRNLMCLSFLRLGMCPNRETCNYAHNMVELQTKLELRKTSLCKYWLKGKCENEDCNFAHGEHELQSTVGVFKTTICKYWKQGCCYSGELCRHAHGEADLRPENLPPHLERKKLQQRSRLLNRNATTTASGRRRGRSDGSCDADDLGNALDDVPRQGEVTFECLRQVICDSGIFLESKAGVPVSSLDTLLADVKESTKQRRHTEDSNSSDLSTDVLLSSASESPRGVPSRGGTSLSSSSTWSMSPEHSFAPPMSGLAAGNRLSLPPALLAGRRATDTVLESRSFLDLQAFACNATPSNFIGMRCKTAPPPGLSAATVLRATASEGGSRGTSGASDKLDGSAKPSADGRSVVTSRSTPAQRCMKWPAAW